MKLLLKNYSAILSVRQKEILKNIVRTYETDTGADMAEFQKSNSRMSASSCRCICYVKRVLLYFHDDYVNAFSTFYSMNSLLS